MEILSEPDITFTYDLETFEETPLMENHSFGASCEAAMKHFGDQVFSHISQCGTVSRLLLVNPLTLVILKKICRWQIVISALGISSRAKMFKIVRAAI